jgi:hypothetical protein
MDFVGKIEKESKAGSYMTGFKHFLGLELNLMIKS